MNQNFQDIEENLLLQYLHGNADKTDRDKVENWLKADKRNRKHLDQLEALWLKSGKLDPPPLPVDISGAWDRMSDRIDKYEAEQIQSHKKSTGIRYLKYAMGAAAMIILAFGVYGILRIFSPKVKNIEISTTASIIYDTLPDNSHIMLNRQTKLTYPARFSGADREVKLRGEAYFTVTKDPSKPFIVDMGIAKVEVLGTVFNISAYPGRNIQVTVTEGRVKFFRLEPGKTDTLSLILEAGMTGMLSPGAMKPEIVEKPIPDRLFWVNHTLEFNGTSLSDVFALVEKYYGVKISVSTADIYNCRLFASFENDPVNRIMNVIAESFGLKLTIEGNNYYLSGNACSKGNN